MGSEGEKESAVPCPSPNLNPNPSPNPNPRNPGTPERLRLVVLTGRSGSEVWIFNRIWVKRIFQDNPDDASIIVVIVRAATQFSGDWLTNQNDRGLGRI